MPDLEGRVTAAEALIRSLRDDVKDLHTLLDQRNLQLRLQTRILSEIREQIMRPDVSKDWATRREELRGLWKRFEKLEGGGEVGEK